MSTKYPLFAVASAMRCPKCHHHHEDTPNCYVPQKRPYIKQPDSNDNGWNAEPMPHDDQIFTRDEFERHNTERW